MDDRRDTLPMAAVHDVKLYTKRATSVDNGLFSSGVAHDRSPVPSVVDLLPTPSPLEFGLWVAPTATDPYYVELL